MSADSVTSHRKFSQRYQLPYSLIADEDHRLINAYDVWGKKSLFGVSFDGLVRTTFLINENGIIDSVIDSVKTNNHSAQILEFYEGVQKK